MSQKSRKDKLNHASDVLQRVLQNGKSPLGQQFQRWRLWNDWEKVVGPSVAKNSTPVAYSRGLLVIWVKNSVYLQEMTFMAGPIREKINEYVGKKWIHTVKFTLDRRNVPKTGETFSGWRDFLSKVSPSEDGEPPHDQ